jgi:type II secretory ATPase GspE/PulE/Tfp pilus assembly ATPase PilB-like protein
MKIKPTVTQGEMAATEKNIERGIPKGMEGPEKVINYILGQAILNNVSCIHFEAGEKGVFNKVQSKRTRLPEN